MKTAFRTLLLVSLLLFVASWVTCYFGVQHEINKIPPDVRARMGDTDWVGVEWINRGMLLEGIAFILLSSDNDYVDGEAKAHRSSQCF